MVPSRISVVLVEETKAGDTSRPQCPCDDHKRQPLAHMTGRGGAVYEGSDGPVVTGSPIGPCETLSPRKKLSALEPLEHSVPDEILERSSRRKLSALEPLEDSVPDVVLERSSRKKLSALDLLEHSGLDQAGPVGRQFAYVTGSPIGPCETLSPRKKLSALEPLEHSVPDEIIERSSRRKLSALEPLEDSVPDVVLERSSRKKLSALDLLEHSGLDQAGPVGRQFAYVAGRSRSVVAAGGSSSAGTANPVGSDGPVVTGSPIGPCETSSPFFQSALEPLEHSVPEVVLERSSRKKLSALEPFRAFSPR